MKNEFFKIFLENRNIAMQTIIDNDISMNDIENEIEKQGLAKKDLKELAHMMMLSLTSIQNTYRKHRDNFNVDAFLADIQKINPTDANSSVSNRKPSGWTLKRF